MTWRKRQSKPSGDTNGRLIRAHKDLKVLLCWVTKTKPCQSSLQEPRAKLGLPRGEKRTEGLLRSLKQEKNFDSVIQNKHQEEDQVDDSCPSHYLFFFQVTQSKVHIHWTLNTWWFNSRNGSQGGYQPLSISLVRQWAQSTWRSCPQSPGLSEAEPRSSPRRSDSQAPAVFSRWPEWALHTLSAWQRLGMKMDPRGSFSFALKRGGRRRDR